jgi:hypothetical protein
MEEKEIEAIIHGNRFTHLTRRGEQEINMKGNGRSRKPCIKSHKRVISRSHGAEPLAQFQ